MTIVAKNQKVLICPRCDSADLRRSHQGENGVRELFRLQLPSSSWVVLALHLLNGARSLLRPVSEMFLARSGDHVELLLGFAPILLHQSVSRSSGGIFLVSLFQL